MFQEYNRKRDEQHKVLAEPVSAVNPSSLITQHAQKHSLTMNSRVQLSDPPRYGVIRWMGDLPQVNGLIAGVELVSYSLLGGGFTSHLSPLPF